MFADPRFAEARLSELRRTADEVRAIRRATVNTKVRFRRPRLVRKPKLRPAI